ALSELRPPVGHEALRLRMVAMNGREDALLDQSRFPRLLRQANDAEIADVRKLGDDEYEISPHRSTLLTAPAAQAASAPAPPAEEATAEHPVGAQRENGQRLGVRFRRGSRAPLRTAEIPLVGVVQVEAPAEAAVTEPEGPPEVAKRARPRRGGRKPAKATATAAAAPADAAEASATPAKRPRSRARKKAE
ncbi:MAG: hypothetical protein ACREMG_00610, partial [Gemmatimonadales bacterium]